MKAAFYTLGCKVNQYESEYMAELLQKAGFEIVQPSEEADYYIVNSCTVTATADKKTRQSVRRFKRMHPDAVVILTGCMPQAFPDSVEALAEADIVLSNKNNADILTLINEYNVTKNRLIHIEKHKTGDAFSACSISGFGNRIRAFVKIQDGCDRFCSYCIIPMSRGRVRSKPLDELKEEVNKLANNGIKEIVLVGINLSSYGKGSDIGLVDAVRVCNDHPSIVRVRLGSLEPDHITDEVIDGLASCEKLCPQFHISLQSGSDTTLKNMNRHYTADEFRSLCSKLRQAFKDCTLTTDIMTGFHQESEEDFITSVNFMKEIGFEKVHVFPYSQREGTAASRRGDSVSKADKERRAAIMIREAQNIRTDYMNRQIGKTLTVLFEQETETGVYQGYTKNYIPVRYASSENLIGKEAAVTIRRYDVTEDCCFA